jgi:hypothetical protein
MLYARVKPKTEQKNIARVALVGPQNRKKAKSKTA